MLDHDPDEKKIGFVDLEVVRTSVSMIVRAEDGRRDELQFVTLELDVQSTHETDFIVME